MGSINGILAQWALEVEAERREGIDNTLIALANMYNYYKSIKAGGRPKLTMQDLDVYRMFLLDFRNLRMPQWIFREHPEVLPALEEAYSVVRDYVLERNKLRVIEGGQE